MHLLLAVELGRAALVQTLQYAVVLLVEPPRLLDGYPVQIERREDDVERAHGAFEIGGVGRIERKALRAQQLACGDGLGDAVVRQVDVGPAGKTVLAVPQALPVAQQYYAFFRVHIGIGFVPVSASGRSVVRSGDAQMPCRRISAASCARSCGGESISICKYSEQKNEDIV